MERHLKPEQHYIDLYDRHTVERCRDLVEIHSALPKDVPALGDGSEPPKSFVESTSKMALQYSLMFEKGNRYIQKEETIARWMAVDRERDDLYTFAKAPTGIRCLSCRSPMQLLHKDFWPGGLDGRDRVLFMFDCPNKCLPRRAFYDNGEEWVSKPNPCPKCGRHLDTEDKTTMTKYITSYTCASCDFSKTEELVRAPDKKQEPDPNFDADRTRFCLTKEEGEEWQRDLFNFEQLKKLVGQMKERNENKEVYDEVAKIKKLTIVELEKLLNPALEKGGYIKLQLSNPEIGKDVIVPFGVHESRAERTERASEHDLKRLFKETLDGTNWRLMSDGVSYRLGFLSGRLRGYEREEDLIGLVR